MNLKIFFQLSNLDKICALLGAIVSFLLILYSLTRNGSVTYPLVATMIFIVCVLWFFIRIENLDVVSFFGSRRLKMILVILFFLLFIGSVLSVYLRPDIYERPLIYFVITSLMAGIIACEILFTQKNFTFILCQIMLLGASIAWSQLMIFPSIVGNDTWYHYYFTTQILNTHDLPKGYSYSQFPLFPLLIATTSFFTGLDYKLSAMFSASIGQIICTVLFIYLIGKKLLNRPNIGLLASLLVVIADFPITMASQPIPNSLAVTFIPIFIYILLFMKNNQSLLNIVLSFLVMAAIIATHTIAAMCTMIFLFGIWFVTIAYKNIFKKYAYFTIFIPIIFSMSMFSWWIYKSDRIITLSELIGMGFTNDYFNRAPTELHKYVLIIPLFEQIFINFGMFIFFALSIIGILYLLSRKADRSAYAISFIGITPLLISFFMMSTGRTILDQRWWFIAQIFLSIPLAISLIIILIKIKKTVLKVVFIIGIVTSLTFLNIMSPVAQMDNNYFTPGFSIRTAPIESELSAATILDHYNGTCMTDSYFDLRILGNLGYTSDNFGQEIYEQNLTNLKGNIILVRSDILNKPFILFSSAYKLNYNLRASSDNTFSQIYDSGSVYTYV